MKIKISAILFLGLIPTLLSGCSNENPNKKPFCLEINTFEEKFNIPTYLYFVDAPNYRMDGGSMTEDGASGTILNFFNGSTIPYLSISQFLDSYLNTLGMLGGVTYSCAYEEKLCTVTNEKSKSTCLIDFDTGLVTFNSFTGFFNINRFAIGEGDYCPVDTEDNLFFKNKEYSITKSAQNYTIDLNKYHVPAYFYNNEGYMPIYFESFLLSTMNPIAFFGVIYNGVACYYLSGENSETWIQYCKNIIEENDFVNDEYMRLNYDCLAFLMDQNYGIKNRLMRHNNTMHNYRSKDIYDILAPYKDRLLDKNNNNYDKAMIELFAKEFDDGGHTGYSPCSILKNDISVVRENGEDAQLTVDSVNFAMEAREKTEYALSKLNSAEETQCSYNEIDDTAFVTFDTFVVGINPDDTTYHNDTIKLIKYANEKIRENNIKNVVLDISANGGGQVIVERFIESWVCGQYHSKDCNLKDGSVTEIIQSADVNGDGIYDENDYLKDNFDVYCIISNGSFSCGNLLPCQLKDYSDTKFIGSRTAGGCCSVQSNRYLPLGGVISYSSNFCSLRKAASFDNLISNDDGVEPDFLPIPFDEEHIAEYYDRVSIVNKIHEAKK